MSPFQKTILILLVVMSQGCSSSRRLISVYSIGDSTMADKKPEVYPETGWCQAFPQFLKKNIILRNHAVNGRSSKSFIDEGRWQVVVDSLEKGDYVFIQFGHNDEKIQDSTRYTEPHTTYKANLERFVMDTRGEGANPVLFTSIVRRKFNEQAKLVDTHGEYPEVVREVARALQVPLVDLQKLTGEMVSGMGVEASKQIYLWTEPDNRFPQRRKDDTHLSREGAAMVAGLAAKELRRLHEPLTIRKPVLFGK